MSTMERDASEVWIRLREIWPELDWDAAEIRHGAFHHVAVLGDTAVVRVTFAREHRAQTQAEYENLLVIAGARLPYVVPEPLYAPHAEADWSALAMSTVGGEHRIDLPWTRVRDEIARVLNDLTEVPVDSLAGLRPPRAWCGGDCWPDIIGRITVSLSSDEVRAARQVVSEVMGLEYPASPALVHGDFGLHNLMWEAEVITGIIDFDNACVADPVIDLAPLVGAFGSSSVLEITDADAVARAKVHRASLSLQVAAAADLAGDVGLRDFTLQNFVKRYRAGTLYEPDL